MILSIVAFVVQFHSWFDDIPIPTCRYAMIYTCKRSIYVLRFKRFGGRVWCPQRALRSSLKFDSTIIVVHADACEAKNLYHSIPITCLSHIIAQYVYVFIPSWCWCHASNFCPCMSISVIKIWPADAHRQKMSSLKTPVKQLIETRAFLLAIDRIWLKKC